MNGHASSDSSESYAPLTSGLLARKGQAQPAFDSDAYAEVMIGDGFAAPISPIFNKPGAYAPNPGAREPGAPNPGAREPGAREPGSPRAENDASESPAPRRRQSQSSARSRPAPAFRAAKDGAIHAMVTFRLAREEFARLRRAAKELDMTCHRIILDAIECYLDANEVEPVKNEQWAGGAQDADDNA